MKTLKKSFLFLLCAVMIFGATATRVPYEEVEARTIFDVEEELKEYQNLLKKLQSELSSITSNIEKLEGQQGESLQLMQQCQAEIDVLQSEIDINTAIMESYDLKRAEVLTEKAMIEEDYEYRVSMYKKLMQFIYENSETNAFEMLFSSDNFSDYLTKRDNFNDIMTAANSLLKEIEASLNELEVLDNELAEAQKKYTEYLEELNRKELDLETKVKQFETIAESFGLDAEALGEDYKDKNAVVQQVKAKIKELEEERKKYYSVNSAFGCPIKDGYSFRLTSRFGWRNDPFGKPTTEYHKGIDLACPRGTPIVAVADGIVTRASWNGGYGECVTIYHGSGISSLYAHCDNTTSSRPVYEVKVGDAVKKGDVIAYVGTTGRSTGYHLHFGVIDTNTYTSQAGNYVNPENYLPKWIFG